MRRAILAGLVVCLAGASVLATQAEPQKITVSSPVLKDGQPMPKDYTADGKNISPPLSWSNVPAGHEGTRADLRGSGGADPAAVRALGASTRFPRRRRACPRTCRSTTRRRCRQSSPARSRDSPDSGGPIWRGPAPPKPGVVAPVSLHRLRARRPARRSARSQQDAAARGDERAHHRSGPARRDLRTRYSATGASRRCSLDAIC